MRKIKFRAWDAENNNMMYDYISINNKEIMQFTGMYDKNNNEIYEGDIIQYGDEICTVEYLEDDGCFCALLDDNVKFDFSTLNSRWYEIVGNIYDRRK